MLTNHLLGASHNAATHTPRGSAVTDTVEQPGMTTRIDAASDHITMTPVTPPDEGKAATGSDAGRPALEIPKRVEMTIAVIDSIPDAVPQSIYEAKAVPETDPESA